MYQTFATFNNKFPSEGPKTLPIVLTPTGATDFPINLLTEVEQKKISMVQGLFFNNVDGPDTIIVVDQTQQVIKLPAGKQGTILLLTTDVPSFTVSPSAAGTVRLQFLNFPVLTAIF